jgi:hypothetical protein
MLFGMASTSTFPLGQEFTRRTLWLVSFTY